MKAATSYKQAFVSNTSWSIYNFRVEILRSLIVQGHKVYVLAPRDAYSSKLIAEGVHYIPIEMDNYGMNPLKDLRLIWSFYQAYKTYRFDRIYHYTIKPNIYGGIAAYLSSIKEHYAVVTGLGKMFNFQSPISSVLSKMMYKLACKVNTQTWFLNFQDQTKFIEEGLCAPYKTQVLPSEGINTSKFRPGSVKESHIVRFLFAGRLLKSKGIELYIDAAKEIKSTYPNIRFEVLGFIDEKNPDSITYEEISYWQHQGAINYLGSTEDVRPYIQRSDCLLFPSYYQEGLSRILLESASMATPIITTDQVGCSDVVIEGLTGYLCEKKNLKSLIDCIERFLCLTLEDRMSMGLAGRQLVKDRYDIELVKSFYLDKNRTTISS